MMTDFTSLKLLTTGFQLVVLYCVWVTGLAESGLASDQIPGKKQTKPIVLKGAMVHTVSGGNIEAGSMVFVDGKITAIGKEVAIPDGAEIIDCAGKHIYPGLFDAHSQIGLIEIEAVRATVDVAETGSLNPNVRAEVAFNPDSELIPVTRANGVLLGLSAPTGSLVHGRSAVMQLDGWTWEHMSLKMNVGMHVRWPRPMARGGRRGNDSGQTRSEDSSLEELNDWIKNAKLYQAAREAAPEKQPWDARLEATLPVIEGQMPLVVEADQAAQIESAIAFAKAHQLRLIISGGYDAELCAPLLRETNTPVIIAGVYRVPQRESDPYDAAYTLPERLQKNGIKFAVAAADRFGGSNIRNLPYHAATAVAYGLNPESAIRSITLSPAEILGVADRVGSLDVGKDATLFVADGDILETPTQVERAFVQGRIVDLGSGHTQLFRKYSEKYKQLSQ
jgi:imidazolonepropionase-like amidohydrolase